jgi:signal transduction histidine kinase
LDLHAESKHEEINISQLVSEISDEFKPQAEAKRQQLTLSETAPGTKVQGDPLQLRQAFRNLIGNAIKYTPEGGAISVCLTEDAGCVKVHIQDTGYGIPANDLPHIFDRFYRVRNAGHDEIEGNGLGLAIVKTILEQHGGNITVESELGNGSCFAVSLPALQDGSLNVASQFHDPSTKVDHA